MSSLAIRPYVDIDYGSMTPTKYESMLLELKKHSCQFAIEIATEIKDSLRAKYYKTETMYTANSAQEALVRSKRFWSLYELVNRVLDELDPVYSIVNAGATLSITADTLTFQAAAAGQGRIIELIISGESTATAVNRIALQRAGTSITSNTPITPEKFNTRSAAATGVYGKAGTQALVGNPMLVPAINTFGGFVRWVAQPGEEIYFVNSEVVSLRSASGTSVVSCTGVFEEL